MDEIKLIVPEKFDPDKEWWEGFDAAIELVMNVMQNSSYASLDIIQELDDEVENYKKDA
jgi:hypothetical protein